MSGGRGEARELRGLANRYAGVVLAGLGITPDRHVTIETQNGVETVLWSKKSRRWYGDETRGDAYELARLIHGERADAWISKTVGAEQAREAARLRQNELTQLAAEESKRRFAVDIAKLASEIEPDGWAAAYLRSRGITDFSDVLQHDAPVAYSNTDDGRIEPRTLGPSLIALSTSDDGRVVGAQAIRINPKTARKITGSVPKWTVGSMAKGYARFGARGSRRVIVCEGVETGKTLAVLFPDHLILVCLGPLKLKTEFKDIADASEIIVHVEIDKKTRKPKADDIERVKQAAERHPQAHWFIANLPPGVEGTDANDLLQSQGPTAVVEMVQNSVPVQGEALALWVDYGISLNDGTETILEMFRDYVSQFNAAYERQHERNRQVHKSQIAQKISVIINKINGGLITPDEIAEAWADVQRVAIAPVPDIDPETVTALEISSIRHNHLRDVTKLEPVVMGFDLTAGGGKTRGFIVEVAPSALKRGHVVVYVPDHVLGEQLYKDLDARNMPARHVYGRTHGMETGESLCQIPEAAEAVSKVGGSVKSSLCERMVADKNGNLKKIRCPHHPAAGGACRYLSQWWLIDEETEHSAEFGNHEVWIVPQSYALSGARRPPFPKNIVLEVFDESLFRPALVTPGKDEFDLTVGAMATPPSVHSITNEGDLPDDAINDDIRRIFGALRMSIATGKLKISDLKTKSINAKMLSNAIQAIRRDLDNMPSPKVDPKWTAEKIEAETKRFAATDPVRRRLALKPFISILRSLLASIDCENTDEVHGIKVIDAGPKIGRAVALRYRRSINLTGAGNMIMLDASAKPELAACLHPSLTPDVWKRVQIDTPQARVTQVGDHLFSRMHLCPGEDAPENARKYAPRHRRDFAWYLEKRTLDARRIKPGAIVGVIGPKPLCDPDSDIFLGREFPQLGELGVRFKWYGKLRGQNDFEDCDVVVQVSRDRPPVEVIEDQTFAWFYDQDVKIKPLKPGANLPKRDVLLRAREGRRFQVAAEFHPDPRCQMIFEAGSADELYQGAHRPRGVRRHCEIDLISSAPVDITVDRLVSVNELLPSAMDLAIARVKSQDGILPLTPADLSMAFPDIWPTRDKARRALEATFGPQYVWASRDGKTPYKRLWTFANSLFGDDCCFSAVEFPRNGKTGWKSIALAIDTGESDFVERLERTVGEVGEVTIIPIASPADEHETSRETAHGAGDADMSPQMARLRNVVEQALHTGVVPVGGPALMEIDPDRWRDPHQANRDAKLLDFIIEDRGAGKFLRIGCRTDSAPNHIQPLWVKSGTLASQIAAVIPGVAAITAAGIDWTPINAIDDIQADDKKPLLTLRPPDLKHVDLVIDEIAERVRDRLFEPSELTGEFVSLSDIEIHHTETNGTKATVLASRPAIPGESQIADAWIAMKITVHADSLKSLRRASTVSFRGQVRPQNHHQVAVGDIFLSGESALV